jgi:hypothetical protein
MVISSEVRGYFRDRAGRPPAPCGGGGPGHRALLEDIMLFSQQHRGFDCSYLEIERKGEFNSQVLNCRGEKGYLSPRNLHAVRRFVRRFIRMLECIIFVQR